MNRRRDFTDLAEAYYIGLMSSLSYRKNELAKPMIAIVNSLTDVNPGHKPLAALAAHVK